jgi:hypothetical protein
MQLVAYGAQDIYLTGNPQITFFKVVYRRHTNFSMEAIEQTLSGSVGFGNKVTATVSRNGDLIHKMYVEYKPSSLLSGVSAGRLAANISNNLLEEMELEIGGQRIDKHYGHWLTVWQELTETNPTGTVGAVTGTTGVQPAQGSSTLFQNMTYNHLGDADNDEVGTNGGPALATVPLQFWFCRNPGLALPLIALQYHEVKVSLKICPRASVNDKTDGTVSFAGFRLYVDYIYLDTDERRRFAQQSHEYLIEQLQFHKTTAASADLTFNHPVKELVFVGTPVAVADGGLTGPATPVALTSTNKYKLKLNGHDRFQERERNYFTRTQVYQHHNGYGGTSVADSIGVYSFALKPEEHQPSGTCNFSRIDNARLEMTAAENLNVYAVNYNVLRVMSGMGGLAYSN